MNAVTQVELDQQVYDLYDEYCHGRIDRREFLRRAGALGAGALTMAYGLMPDYARAQTISFTDSRIKAQYVSYASPGGNGEKMRGYLVQPAGQGPWPAVLVIHENRGLNPYVEDVARRAAGGGVIALGPDGRTPAGGNPGNDAVTRPSALRTTPGNTPSTRHSVANSASGTTISRGASCASAAPRLRGNARKLMPNALTKQTAASALVKASSAPASGKVTRVGPGTN